MEKKSKIIILILAVLVIWGVVAHLFLTPSTVETVGSKNITDMVGRTVQIPASVGNVVATSPPMTTVIYMIAPEKLTAVNFQWIDDELKYIPSQYAGLPVVGGWYGTQDGSYEEFIASEPDMVIESIDEWGDGDLATVQECRDKFGEILINGENIEALSFSQISKHIGYIPQSHVPSFPFTVFDVVLMGRAPYLNLTQSPRAEDEKIAIKSLKTLGIYDLKDKEYTNLSGGERQLVFLARVLTQQPDILILDEPTSHLDFGNQIKLLEIIDKLAEAGLSVIMSSHFPDHAFLSSTKVAIMKNKKFIDFGAPGDVVTEDNLKEAYSIDVKLIELDENRKVCVPMKTNLKLDI